MRIALFITCFNDAFFPRTGMALVRVLEDLGHRVGFPEGQTCCGQIHFNTGYRAEAYRLLRRFMKVFGGADVVVAPSASCVAMVREQYPVLAGEMGDGGLETEVRELAARTFELTEFLVRRLGVESLGAVFPGRVAFHPTCHSIRGIDVGDAPLRLLKEVKGAELVELEHAEECCGFGGTFSVKNPHTSLAMLQDKINDVRRIGAEVLTAVDNSCLIHIAGGLRRHGLLMDPGPRPSSGIGPPAGPDLGIRVMHLAEILASREGECW